jgi:hypothetical protein
MMKTLKRIIYAMPLLLLCFALAQPAAYAAEPPDLTKDGSFTIVMKYEDNAINGAGITLYRVADAKLEGDHLVYTAATAFETASVSFDELGLDSKKNLDAATVLRSYALQNVIAGTARTTGADGKAKFEELSSGLYLVAQTGSTAAYRDISPFLLSVPMANADKTGWFYDIESLPKTEISVRPPQPSQPQPPPASPEPETSPEPEVSPTPEPTSTPETTPTPPTVTPTSEPSPPPGPDIPPPPTEIENTLVPTDEGTFIEIGPDGTPLGEWRWDPEEGEWIYDEYPPLGELPQTGRLQWPVPVMALAGMTLFTSGWAIKRGKSGDASREEGDGKR